MCVRIGLALADASETLATPKDVVKSCKRSNDSVDHADVYVYVSQYLGIPQRREQELTVHVACGYWFSIRERIHDQSKQCPQQQHNVGEEANASEPERPWLDVGTTSDEEANDRDGIA
jgi:ElaB/YqjD/DUF883 family membrane-anchored ribosome-binding protein